MIVNFHYWDTILIHIPGEGDRRMRVESMRIAILGREKKASDRSVI